jgi:hypothetical protein
MLDGMKIIFNPYTPFSSKRSSGYRFGFHCRPKTKKKWEYLKP